MRTFIFLFAIVVIAAIALLSFVHFHIWVPAFISAVICHIAIDKIRVLRDLGEMEPEQ